MLGSIKALRRPGDVATGVVVVLLSGLLFWASNGIRDFGAIGVGSAFLPRLVAGALLVLGILVLHSAWRAVDRPTGPAPDASATDDSPRPSPFTSGPGAVAISFGLMLGYLLLLEPLGFLLASVCYVFLQMLLLCGGQWQKYRLLLLAAVIPTLLAYLLFVNVFQITLPQGIIG